MSSNQERLPSEVKYVSGIKAVLRKRRVSERMLSSLTQLGVALRVLENEVADHGPLDMEDQMTLVAIWREHQQEQRDYLEILRAKRTEEVATPQMPQVMEERLLTMQDVCRWLGVTRVTVYRWIRDRDFPVLGGLGGRSTRFAPADVRRWLESEQMMTKKIRAKDPIMK